MARLIREFDWGRTPLGQIEDWPGELRTLVELILASPLVASVVCGPARLLLYNDGLAKLYGDKHPSALGRPLSETWPDDEEVATTLYDRVFAGEMVHVPAQPLDLSGRGEDVKIFNAIVTPVRDRTGRVVYAYMIGFEISSHIRAEEERIRAETVLRESESRTKLLHAELQHRVRNMLGVVRSIARRTAATSETIEDYAMHLDGRINAFARVQAIVARNPTAGVDLAMLVADELLAHGAQEGQRLRHLRGPKVHLASKAAASLALAIHELATNAVKYGALAKEKGQIEVGWTVTESDDGKHLVFTWKETGVPRASRRRRGFGSELIERTLAYELGAEASLSFEAGGLRCTIRVPAQEMMNVGS